MDAVLWVVVSVFVVFMVIALAFIIKLKKRPRDSEIHMSGGADIDKGYLSNDNNYFKGGYKELDETVVVGYDYKTADSSKKNVRFIDLNTKQTFTLDISEPVVFGRSASECGFVIENDTLISKRHCRMFLYFSGVYIEDLGSSNHTFVNSRRISSPCMLNKGDVIKVGNTKFKIDF